MRTVYATDNNGHPVHDPTSFYAVSDAGTVQYFGFLSEDGRWYIQKYDTTAKTFRYTTANSAYPASWTNRASLTYDYFSEVF
jgi:hypothetical protein